MKKPESVTQEEVKKLLHYSSSTGILIWRKARRGIRYDMVDVYKGSGGFIIININYRNYRAHRLIWLYVYGTFPEYTIDHIDRNRTNNKIKNLRDVPRFENMRNTINPSDNKSGVKGIRWESDRNKWYVQITVHRKKSCLGRFTSFTEAVYHRLAAEQCLGWLNHNSTSPAFLYVNSEAPKPPKLTKRSYASLRKSYHNHYRGKKKLPEYPKSGKLTVGLKKFYIELEVTPRFYGEKK